MVREQIPDAVFCTNLYGEILELYREGCLQIPEDDPDLGGQRLRQDGIQTSRQS